MNKLYITLALLVVAPVAFAEEAPKVSMTHVESLAALNAKAVALDAAKVAADKVAAAKEVLSTASKAAVKAQNEADKAVKALAADASNKEALTVAAAIAKANADAAKTAVSDFDKANPCAGVKAYAQAMFDKMVVTCAANPKIAAATIVAMTIAAVEAIHYFASEVDEEDQF